MSSAPESGGEDAAPRARRMAEIQEAIRNDPRSRPSGLRAGLHGLGLLLVAGIPAVYVWTRPSWLHWVLYWALATLACASIPAIIHEAFHRGLARNHFINDAFGSIVAGLNWSPLLCWKYFHFEHHANAGLANDAEVYPPTWSRLSMLGFPLGNWSFFLFLWKATWGTARGKGPAWVRSPRQARAIVLNSLVAIVVQLGIVVLAICDLRVIPLVWIPLALGCMLGTYTMLPEHLGAHGRPPRFPDELDRTVSIRSNAVTRFFLWSCNLHAAHHFAPNVPAHYLLVVDELLAPSQSAEWRWRGYYAWYGAHLRALPWVRPSVHS